MEKWHSVSQLNNETGVPETTIRRYLNNFSEYFRAERIGRGMKYHPDSVAILKRIYSLYNDDYETPEIQRLLDMEFAINVEDQEETETTTQPPVVSLEREFEEFKQQQQEFNKQLLKQLQEQQNYINNSIESRDQKLMQALNEIRETKKQIATTEEKRWWEFWK